MTNSNADHPAIKETVAALDEVRAALQTNDLRAAQRRLEQARDALMAHPAHEAPVRQMKAAVFAELGLLHQRLHNPDDAQAQFDQAAELARGLVEETSDRRHVVQLATTLINASGTYARGDAQRGLDMTNEALTMLRKIDEDGTPMRRVLLLGGLQNQATLLLALKNPAAAEATLVEAQQISNNLLSEAPQLIGQAIELNGRLSGVQRMQGKADEALASAHGAARLAEAAYQGGAKQGIVWYVKTQMALVDGYFVLKQFATAEDHLWKAIDTSKSPQTMMLGTTFYCSLLRQTDELLSEGGLPREEVVEALDELLGRMEELKAPADLMEVLRLRYQLLVDNDQTSAEAWLTAVDSEGRDIGPGAADMRKHLEADLSWRKSQA